MGGRQTATTRRGTNAFLGTAQMHNESRVTQPCHSPYQVLRCCLMSGYAVPSVSVDTVLPIPSFAPSRSLPPTVESARLALLPKLQELNLVAPGLYSLEIVSGRKLVLQCPRLERLAVVSSGNLVFCEAQPACGGAPTRCTLTGSSWTPCMASLHELFARNLNSNLGTLLCQLSRGLFWARCTSETMACTNACTLHSTHSSPSLYHPAQTHLPWSGLKYPVHVIPQARSTCPVCPAFVPCNFAACTLYDLQPCWRHACDGSGFIAAKS